MRIVVDTSVCVALLRRAGSSEAASVAMHLSALGEDTEIVLSSIVAAELAVGLHLAQQPANSRKLYAAITAAFSQHAFGFEAAEAYSRLRAALRKSGRSAGTFDELIAAHALAIGAEVATLNARDFGQVPGLRVRDWGAAA